MSRNKQICLLTSALVVLALSFQGCGLQSPPTDTAVPVVSSATVSPSVETSPPATATLAPNTPSPEPTPSPTPSPTPIPSVKASPAQTSPYIVNEYSASDGKVIYYKGHDGTYCMNLDGSNNHRVIKDCFEFVAIDRNGLYYTVYDQAYTPTKEEEILHQIFVPQYNLMFYDAKKKKVSTIQKHVYQVAVGNGWIYMVDHVDHTKLYGYSMNGKTLKKVTGYTHLEGYDLSNMGFDNQVYFYCDPEHDYILIGDRAEPYKNSNEIANEDASYMDPILTSSIDNPWSVLINNVYQPIQLENILNVIQYKNDYIVITECCFYGSLSEHEMCILATIYKISSDGKYTKLYEQKCFNDYSSSYAIDESLNGWIFLFWMGDEGITAEGLAMKYHID